MSKFNNKILDIVKIIPSGKVASYGQVALFAGLPRAARQVGWILNKNEGKSDIPWWRVVNNKGRITLKGTKYVTALDQKALLVGEGVDVGQDLTLDIEKYRWKPDTKILDKLALDDDYIRMLISKFGM